MLEVDVGRPPLIVWPQPYPVHTRALDKASDTPLEACHFTETLSRGWGHQLSSFIKTVDQISKGGISWLGKERDSGGKRDLTLMCSQCILHTTTTNIQHSAVLSEQQQNLGLSRELSACLLAPIILSTPKLNCHMNHTLFVHCAVYRIYGQKSPGWISLFKLVTFFLFF